MKFCDNAHRVAHNRRAERTGPEYSDSIRLLYKAGDLAVSVGRTLRKKVGPMAKEAGDFEFEKSDDDLRRLLAQARKQLGFAMDYLRWAEEGFINSELSEEARDELADLLNNSQIDDEGEERC
jgi:hypothetical protein